MKSALKYELMSPLWTLRARTLFFGKFLKMYEAWLYSLNRAIQSWWCARQDLNLHAHAMEPKGYVTLVKDFQSPPYHKGRASFPTLQKIFRSWPAEHLLNHSTLCRKSIAWLWLAGENFCCCMTRLVIWVWCIVNLNAILKSEVTALQFIHLFRVTDCDANSIPPLILRL